jgi:hypothetical protein
MISSTVEDLGPERGATDRAVRHFYFERFRSELMGSLALSSKEVCEAMARTCHVYILIAGFRYGWEIPGSAISVTELEYRTARQADPSKILVYVKADPDHLRESREATFVAEVTDFSTGYFRARPFENADDLCEQVKADLGVWVSDRIVKGDISASTVFGLPDSAEIRVSLRNLGVVVAGMALVMGMSRAVEPENYLVPSLHDVWRSISTYRWEFIGAFTRLLSMSVLDCVCALAIWSVLLGFTQLLAQSVKTVVLRSASPILILLLLLTAAFGMLRFPFIDTLLAVGSLAAATYLGSGIKKELMALQSHKSWKSHRAIMKALAVNVLLSQSIPNVFVLAATVTLVSEYWIGPSMSVTRMLFDSRAMFRTGVFIATTIATFVFLYLSHIAIRYLQASVGWRLIQQRVQLGHQASMPPDR